MNSPIKILRNDTHYLDNPRRGLADILGTFSGTEIAFITSDRVRMELDVKSGGFLAKTVGRFYADPNLFISTILVGNNVMLVIYGMGAAALLDPWIESWCTNQAVVLILSTSFPRQ